MTVCQRRRGQFRIAGFLAAAVVAVSVSAEAQPAPLDHFKCYRTKDKAIDAPVILKDQFDVSDGEADEAFVRHPVRFCNPVQKTRADGTVTPIVNENNHLTLYLAAPSRLHPTRVVRYANQFHQATLLAFQPETLAVPTEKAPHEPPSRLDHFKCYRAFGPRINLPVGLRDQFMNDPNVRVVDPFSFCNPVEKSHAGVVTPIVNPDAHLVCYRIVAQPFTGVVSIKNQFASGELTVANPDLLCVPSRKLGFVAYP